MVKRLTVGKTGRGVNCYVCIFSTNFKLFENKKYLLLKNGVILDFHGGPMVKNPTATSGDMCSILELGGFRRVG